MVLTVLAWVLRAAGFVVLVYSLLAFLYGLGAGQILCIFRRPKRVSQPLGRRLLQGTCLLVVATALWVVAGAVERNARPGLTAWIVAVSAVGLVSALLLRDAERRLPSKPSRAPTTLGLVYGLVVVVGMVAANAVGQPGLEPLRGGLVWGAVFFGIVVGGTFVAWAVTRLWLKLKGSPTPQP